MARPSAGLQGEHDLPLHAAGGGQRGQPPDPRLARQPIPLRVDYAVTDLGRDVTALLNAVRVWSEEHINDVLAAWEDYDERAAQSPQPVTA